MKRQPTGNRYQLAAEWVVLGELSAAGLEAGALEGAELVQGYPTLQCFPFAKYGHAWVEAGEMVYDATHVPVLEMPKSVYYSLGHIDPEDSRRYSAREARGLMSTTGHYGPWRSGFPGIAPGDPEPEGTYGGAEVAA